MLKTNAVKIAYLVAILISSILSIVVLFKFSNQYAHAANHFIRSFPPHPIFFLKKRDILYNSFYIAGGTSYSIYLGNYTSSSYILETDPQLNDTNHHLIKYPYPLNANETHLIIDSPYFYCIDWHKHHILYGNLKNLTAQTIRYDSSIFAEVIPISPFSYAIRAFKPNAYEFIFAKETFNPPTLIRFPNLLKKQIDGLFDSDGILQYDKELSVLVYVFHYRNQFICMDTSFNQIRIGKTIDTNSQAKLKVGIISSEHAIKLSSKPFIVSKESCAMGNWLFVRSALIADNEDKSIFAQSSVIDVYNLQNVKYLFSFHLPDVGGKKASAFRVFKNYLVALYGRYIYSYSLNPLFFNVHKN
jgi:hypothetical protein